jgi:hypothetical protein
MIYLFAGDDTQKKLGAYEKFLKTFPEEVEIFPVGKNDFDPILIKSFYSGAGLFFKKCAVIFTNVFEKEEARDFLLKKLELIEKSENIFIFLEGKFKKAELDIFKKNKAEMNIFELPKEKKEKYDSFILAWDFEKKDKLNLWIHFRQAMDRGVGMEELVGILFWKAKDMLLKKNFGKFKEKELKDFASKLSYLLPETRRRGLDDESAFEQFLLEAF